MKNQLSVVWFLSVVAGFGLFSSSCGGEDAAAGADSSGISTEVCPAPEAGFGNIVGEVKDEWGALVSQEDAVTDGTSTGDINGYGRFYICGVPAGQETLVTVKTSHKNKWGGWGGYSPVSRSVTPVDGKDVFVSFRLKNSTSVVLDAATVTAGGLATDGKTKVTFPAAAFVKADGSAFSGPVNVQITTFDSSKPDDLESFPGDFSGLDGENTVGLFSLGFVDVQLFDDEDNPLQLADGKTATLVFPITNIEAGDTTIPMWYFDEAQGTWVREGEGTVDLGANTITAEVSHFSTWNCDKPITLTDCVVGIAKDDLGGAISGAQMYGTGQGKNVADSKGAFCINFYPKSTFEVRGSFIKSGVIYRTSVPSVSFTGPREGGFNCNQPSNCNALAAPVVLNPTNAVTRCLEVSLVDADATIKKYGELMVNDNESGYPVFGGKLGGKTSLCLELPAGIGVSVQLNAFNPGAPGEAFCNPQTFNGADVTGGAEMKLGAEAAACGEGACDEIVLKCQVFNRQPF